jgi:ribose transport system substrate-binding protein
MKSLTIRSAAGATGFLILVAIAAVLLWQGKSRVPVIAVVPETTAQEIWESEHTGAAQAARQLGWNVYWNAPVREDDFQRQIRIVEQSVARRVDGLVLAPDHAIALISPVRSAVAHHIPTVIVASPLGIAPDDGLRYVLNDEAAMGRLGAERAARLMKDGDTAVVIGINPGLLASVQRADAFEKILRRLRPGVKIEERSIRSASAAEAEETAEEAIHSDPHLRVILALNVYQSRSAFGAMQATGKVGSIALIACDQDLDLLFHLRSGGIDTVLAQDTRTMGSLAIETIDAMRKHRPTAAQQMVEPVLITRENVDTDRVQQVLNMDWRAGG